MLNDILKFITENHLPWLLGSLVLWTLLGAVGGLLLGLLAFFGIRKAGGYRLELPAAGWLRVLVGVLTALIALVCGGIVGFQEGAWRGTRRVLLDSNVGERLQAPIGRSGALFLAGFYSLDAPLLTSDPAQARQLLDAKIGSFATGDWELDIVELRRRADNIPVTTTNAALQAVFDNPKIRLPEIQNTPAGKVERWLLRALGEGLVPDATQSLADEMGEREIRRFCTRVYRDLPTEAAKSGNPNTITCRELSVYLGRQSINGLALPFVRAFVRGHQVSVLLFFLMVLAVPVAGFRLAEFIRQRKSTATTTPGARNLP